MSLTITLILLIVLLIIVIAFILLKHIIVIKRRKKIDYLKQANIINKMFAIEKTLIRVTEISEVNDKFKNVAMKLNTLHDKLSFIHSRIKKLMEDIEKEVNKKTKNNSKLVKELILETKNKNKEFLDLEKEFKSYSIQVTHQDEYIRNEFQFYQKNLRHATEAYAHKRILLDKISFQIDSFRNEVKKTEEEFEKIIDKIDIERVDAVLRNYSNLVIKFIKLINEGPSIFVKLYKEIPKLAQNLKNEYIEKKKEIGMSFEHIDFSNSLKEISKIHKNAIKSFKDLDIKKTKKYIKSTLKSFKSLQKMINLEIVSRNVFLKLYDQTLLEVKKVLKSYVLIRKQFKEIVGKGETMPQIVFEKYDLIKKSAKRMDLIGIKYKDLIKDKTLSYSAKLSRSKVVLNNILTMTNEINEFIEMVWNINSEDSLYRNKFKRAEAAINELIANLKTENIKLSISQKKEFDKLIDQKTKLLNLILNKRISKSVFEKIDDFTLKATNLYSIINGNAQIALHIKNMLKELAPKRVINDRLNIMLQMSEKEFLDGMYASSLNTIIEAIKDKGEI